MMIRSLKNRKITLIFFFIFLVYAFIYFAVTFLVVGPGLPPAEMMTEWYLPDSGNNEEYLSFFPVLSEYADSGRYSNSTIMCVWYFEKKSSFLKGEAKLSDYLLESGQVETIELDISEELSDVINKRGNNWRATNGPQVFNATMYQSNESSGYFIVYEKPFLESREDYFIAYYGTEKTDKFQAQHSRLMYLIASSYYHCGGNITALDTQSELRQDSVIQILNTGKNGKLRYPLLSLPYGMS